MIDWILKLNEIINGIEITVTGGYAILTITCYIPAGLSLVKIMLR